MPLFCQIYFHAKERKEIGNVENAKGAKVL